MSEQDTQQDNQQQQPQVDTFETLAARIGALVAEKNAAYGQSYQRAGAILRVLYPNGIKLEQYDDMLAITRVIDKLFRISSGNDGYAGESAWSDVTGYGLLGMQRRQREGLQCGRNMLASEQEASEQEKDAVDGPHDSDEVPF